MLQNLGLLSIGLCAACALGLTAGEGPEDGYELHEWGVFMVPRNAAWANQDMQAEWASMPKEFYGAQVGRNLPYRGPVTKPVIYFHAQKAMKVELTIRFAEGQPTIWWPAAEFPVMPGMPIGDKKGCLLFKPQLIEREKKDMGSPASTKPRKLEVPAGHWIETLRQVQASEVYCAGGWGRGGTSWDTERFIYYDGLMKAPAAPKVERQGASVKLDVPGGEIWQDVMLIEREGKKVRVAEAWNGWKEVAREREGRHVRVEMKEADEARLQSLREELTERLTQAGLHADEAVALVKVWKEGFFDQDGLSVFYRVPQETYEKWLPLEAKPAPKKTVRVGLVLHRHLEPELDARVEKLIKQLGAEGFQDREAAQKELLKIGGAAFPALEKHSTGEDLETAKACREILHVLDARPALEKPKK